ASWATIPPTADSAVPPTNFRQRCRSRDIAPHCRNSWEVPFLMGNSDRAGRMKAAATPAARDLLRVEGRKVEARQRRRTVNVPSPTVPGAVERLQRSVDTIEFLWSRKKLNEIEYDAANIYRSAWDMLQSIVGGQMDFDRVRGGVVPGGPF